MIFSGSDRVSVRTRVKICGLTRLEDAEQAVSCGVDAIGFVFYPGSPRHVEVGQARDIIARLPPLVTVVGLFLDPERAFVEAVLDAVPLDILQFHGQEPAAFCEAFPRRYIKAIPMSGGLDARQYAAQHPRASGFLLDSNAPGERGGLGKVFDWSEIPAGLGRPLILAGGLGPENVAAAIVRYRPYGVDVSSGVESARGVKDPQRMEAFMKEVHGVQDVTSQ